MGAALLRSNGPPGGPGLDKLSLQGIVGAAA